MLSLAKIAPLTVLLAAAFGIRFFELESSGHLRQIYRHSHGHESSSVHRRMKRNAENRDIIIDDYLGQNESVVKVLSVDLLLLLDPTVYNFFAKAQNDPKDIYVVESAVYDYFSTIFGEISRLMTDLSTEMFQMKGVNPAGIIMCKEFTDCPWAGPYVDVYNETTDEKDTDAAVMLRMLRHWVHENEEKLPQNDHVMAVTRRDLQRNGDRRAQGIAYVQTICQSGDSVSVIEDQGGSLTVTVAVHELAHSLGAEHDGRTENVACRWEHNFLMVPVVRGLSDAIRNSFKFSACTRAQIAAYLIENAVTAACLFESLSLPTAYYGEIVEQVPGQRYDVDQQCQFIHGPTFRYCADHDYYSQHMCKNLWCRDISQGRRSSCVTRAYQPALYGTTCGHKMWCIDGVCVEDDAAPSVADCRFNDRDAGFCLKLVLFKPGSCKLETFARFCCRTCDNWMHFGRITTRLRI